jgi:hypothetical protein
MYRRIRRVIASRPVRVGRKAWGLRDPASLLLCLGTAYVGIWVTAPRQTEDSVGQFALLGVFAWPVLAGGVRIMLGGPPLRPPWWAAVWLFIGVPFTLVILGLRADHLTTWPDGVISGTIILVPIAVWRYLRTRRRVRTEELSQSPRAERPGGGR